MNPESSKKLKSGQCVGYAPLTKPAQSIVVMSCTLYKLVTSLGLSGVCCRLCSNDLLFYLLEAHQDRELLGICAHEGKSVELGHQATVDFLVTSVQRFSGFTPDVTLISNRW